MKVLYIPLLVILTVGSACAPMPNSTNHKSKNDSIQSGFFVNPIADGADPWVFKKDGFYYYCGSDRGGIYVSKSDKLTSMGERKIAWEPSGGWNQSNIWAPEIHFINGKWYIYYAAGLSGPPFIHQRSGVLESDDPFGPYQQKGMMYTGDNISDTTSVKWAIDLTTLKMNGKRYAIWSGWEENRDTDKTKQHLYIATMSNPYTIDGNRVKISSPEEPWEIGGPLDLNEGPQILKKDEKIHVIYSTRESWMIEYRLGQLTLSDTLLDPLDPDNWHKTGPVFQGTDEVLGVGHASFTTSPDGTEDWIFYHSKKTTEPGWNRNIRLQKFEWKPDGSPYFGQPIPAGVPIPLPSGEEKD
jgi:GH43 family beta-xylosidase